VKGSKQDRPAKVLMKERPGLWNLKGHHSYDWFGQSDHLLYISFSLIWESH